MNSYWAQYPPLHLLARHYLGYAPKAAAHSVNAARDLDDFAQAFSAAGGVIN